MKRILVLDAHGDDALLGMGGTLALHAGHWGHTVRLVILTDGGSSQYPGDARKLATRQQEVRRAHEILGIQEFRQLDFPDMHLDHTVHTEINNAIERQIREFAPDVLYCVHPDANLDHQCLFRSSLVACRPTPGQVIRRLVTYAPLSSTEWDVCPTRPLFRPNRFVDIGPTIDRKVAAVACLATELRPYPHPRSLEGVRIAAQYEGMRIGIRYAEPLQVIREVRWMPAGGDAGTYTPHREAARAAKGSGERTR